MKWEVNVEGKTLKRGFTSGTAATACIVANIIYNKTNIIPKKVEVKLPQGQIISININKSEIIDGKRYFFVQKDSGDDKDITNKCLIFARYEEDLDFSFHSAGGVGIITKKGLKVSVGQPAINPAPRNMIINHLKDNEINGAKIYVGVVNGEKLAKSTLNERLGIINGISIIGTTGIIEPMSETAWKESLLPQIDIVKNNYDYICLVPGGKSESLSIKYLNIKSECVLLCGNYFGYAMNNSILKGIKNIIISGSYQKLIKLAAGNFNTDSRVSDSKNEIFISHIVKNYENINIKTINKIFYMKNSNEIFEIMKANNIDKGLIFDSINERIYERIYEKYKANYRIVLFDNDVVLSDKSYGGV